MLPFEIKRWFIVRGTARSGPYSIVDLQNLVAQKQLGPKSLARCDGMDEPLPLEQIEELQHIVAIPGLIARPQSSPSTQDAPPVSAEPDEENEKTLVAAPRAAKPLTRPSQPSAPETHAEENERTQIMSDEERAAISKRQTLGTKPPPTEPVREKPVQEKPAQEKAEAEVVQSLELDSSTPPVAAPPVEKTPEKPQPTWTPRATGSFGSLVKKKDTGPAKPGAKPQSKRPPSLPRYQPTPKPESPPEPEPVRVPVPKWEPEPEPPAPVETQPDEPGEDLGEPLAEAQDELESLSESSSGEGTASIAYTNPFVRVGTGTYKKAKSTTVVPAKFLVGSMFIGLFLMLGYFFVQMSKAPGSASAEIANGSLETYQIDSLHDDAAAQEVAELQYAASAPTDSGIKLAVARANDTRGTLKFYLATNLPPHSNALVLLDPFRGDSKPVFIERVQVNDSHFIKLDTLIPYKSVRPGEYYFFAVEDANQPPETEKMLAKMQGAPRKIPALREPKKFVVSKRYTF